MHLREKDYFHLALYLDGLVVVSEQRMQTQQANKREIPKHLVEGVASELARD